MAESPFDSAAQNFDDHYRQMRGYIRQNVTQANLNQTLHLIKSDRLRVLDLEGGAGYDADWLASIGHAVVLIDSSPHQLERAYGQAHLDKASLIQGDIDTALNLYGDTGFDLVLSHGALLYQSKPEEYITKLCNLVRPLGALSLLTAAKLGKLQRFKQKGDQAAIDKLLLSSRYTNNLGLDATAHLPNELTDLLVRQGFSRQAWFGVRIKSDEDRRPVDEVPVFHKNRILAEEIRLSKDRQHRPQAQLLHFIAGRDT